MKIIRELSEEVEYLVEERDGKKQLFVQGPFLVSEAVNKNGRMYTEEVMSKEVDRYTKEYINTNRAVGELGHPDNPGINPDRISHRIVSLQREGNIWIGKALILETTCGMNARKLIEGGCRLGVSSRGMGSLKEVNGIKIVQDDFRLSTAADLVMDPSAPGAFVDAIMENKEWFLVNGVWTEVDQSNARREIQKASPRQIEAVSLKIFENFVNRL